MRRRLTLIVLFIGFVFMGFGQSDIDPLISALDTSRGEARFKIIKRLATILPYRDPSKCLEYIDEGFDLIENLPSTKEKKWSKRNFLLAYQSQAFNNLDKEAESLEALDEMFVNADSLCGETIGPCDFRANVFGTVGGYYFKMKDYEKALENQRKSHGIKKQLNGNIIPSCMNLGMIFEKIGVPDSAIYYKKLGRSKLVKVGAKQKTLTRADYEIALAYKAAQKIDSAINLISQVIDTCAKYDYSLYRKAQMLGAEMHNEKGNFEQSWILLKASKQNILSSGNLEDKSKWYNQSSVSTKGLGMLDSALYFNEQHVILHDSIYEISRDKVIEKAEQSLAVKAKESEMKGLVNRIDWQKNLLGILSLCLLAGMGGFLYYYNKNQKLKQKNTLEIRYYLSGNNGVKLEEEIDDFLKSVLKTIDENLNETDFNVEALANKVFVSRSNLFKKLKSLSGKTPTLLIREMRMEKAKLLLKKKNLPINQIALQTGYEDASYFAKVFKNYFGESPSELAKKLN